MTSAEQAAHEADVRHDYEIEKARILAADYPHKLTFLFNDERVMRDFAVFLCDGGGEQTVMEAADDYGLSCSFDYAGNTQEFLGEGVVRVYSEAVETEEADHE